MAAPVRFLLRSILAGIALLLAAALLLWLLLPWLAPHVARPLLADRGLELERLALDRPGPRGLVVRRIALVHVDSGSRLRAVGLRLSGPAPGPARAALEVERLEVELGAPAPSATPAAQAAPLPPGPALPAWPPLELRVRQLTTALRREGAVWRLEGSAAASPAGATLDGTLAWPGRPAPLTLTGALAPPGALRVTLGTRADPEALVLDGRLAEEAGGAGFAGTLEGRLAPLVDDPRVPILELAVAGAVALAGGGARLRLDPESRAAAGLVLDGATTRLNATLDAPFAVALAADRSLSGEGRLPLRFALEDGIRTVRGSLTLEAPGGSLAEPETGLRLQAAASDGARSLEGTARGRLTRDAADGRVALAPGATLVLRQLVDGTTRLEDLRATLPEGLTPAPATGTVEPAPLRVTLGALEGPQGRVAPVPLEATGTLGHRDGRTALSLALVARDGSLGARAEMQASAASGAGRAELVLRHASLAAEGAAARLAGAFLPGPWPATAGSITGRGDLAWSRAGVVEGSGTLELRDGAGALDGLRLTGGALRAEGRLREAALAFPRLEVEAERLEARDPDGAVRLAARALVLEAPGRLRFAADGPDGAFALRGGLATVESAAATAEAPSLAGSLTVAGEGTAARLRLGAPVIEAGVTLTDARCTVQVAGATLTLTDCGAATLGGQLAMPRAALAPGPDGTLRGSLPVALQGLELAELLALLQDPDLSGTGVLDGAVPVTLAGATVTIEDGRLAARPPGGRLRYAADPSLRARLSQPGIALALDALRDFRYDRLAADADYGGDGTLALDVRLEGANPELEDGRPVHFNLTVTQNLPVLLQSLRLSQNIEESFERRLRERSQEP
jgi:hypothetical protein